MRGEEKLTFAEPAWVVSNQHQRESTTGVETILLLYVDYESSIYLLIYLLMCLSTSLPTYLPPYLPTYLPTHLPSHLPIHLRIYLPM